jgi:hypothetical protein
LIAEFSVMPRPGSYVAIILELGSCCGLKLGGNRTNPLRLSSVFTISSVNTHGLIDNRFALRGK